MNDKSWRDMPPGAARQAARASYYRDRSKPIAENCQIRQVTIDGKTGVRGPSRITHYYNSEAERQVAERLAKTRAARFPTDLVTLESNDDGQLILSCKTRNHKLVIPTELPPNFLAITVDFLAQAEREHRSTVDNNAGTSPETGEKDVRSE